VVLNPGVHHWKRFNTLNDDLHQFYYTLVAMVVWSKMATLEKHILKVFFEFVLPKTKQAGN